MKELKYCKCFIFPFLMTLIFLFASGGCYYFRVTRTTDPTAEDVRNIPVEKFVILHYADKTWHLSGMLLDKDTLRGRISQLIGYKLYRSAESEGVHRYRIEDQPEVLNEVHIFAAELIQKDDGTVFFPVSAITRIDVYDRATGATVASWTFSALGIVAGTLAVITVIVALTKESCPFIYTYNGNDFIFCGEVFSGAVQPGLERDDYMLLSSLVPENGVYKIKITNEAHEIQWLNTADLAVFDHSPGQSVLIDKYGVPYKIKNSISPIDARNTGKTDILDLLKRKDTLSYTGNKQGMNKTGIEETTIKFIRPSGARSARLIIRAKNSFWLESLILKVHRLFGDKYDSYSLKQEKVPGEKLMKWQLDQKLPLLVYMEKNGSWEYVDYFNLPGAMALKDDILPLDLSENISDTIKIKLETGFLFWEIDYVAMDFSSEDMMQLTVLPVKTAVDSRGMDIKPLIVNSDTSRYMFGTTGEEALLTFDLPPLRDSCRSLILHTKGYYKVLREQSGKPDKKRLKKFRKPGMLPAFSKEMFDSLSIK